MFQCRRKVNELLEVLESSPAPQPTDDKYADLLATQPTRYDYTAPPAEHGVLHLGLGLVAALLFSGLLGSCATPARLPLQAGVKAAEHDSRTKLVEPYAVVPAKSVR